MILEKMMRNKRFFRRLVAALIFGAGVSADGLAASAHETSPYSAQQEQQVKRLASDNAMVRAGAIEYLSFMRSFSTASVVVKHLNIGGCRFASLHCCRKLQPHFVSLF